MIEYATYHASQKRGKAILKQQLKDKKNQQRAHGDTTGHCGLRRAPGCETVSLPLAKANQVVGIGAVEQSTNCFLGCGVVFKLDPSGNETVLHSFANSPDGANPFAGLIMDKSGNLYGTTLGGGLRLRNGVQDRSLIVSVRANKRAHVGFVTEPSM